MSAPLPAALPELLLAWYDRHARILPWRENHDPYRVWVSEIMLQQTRVDTVIPYFHRFLEKLPTIHALAEIPEQQLLKLWEGLGYYSRVRNLQKGAKLIVEQFDGIFPSDPAVMKKIPGIGEYTVGAIASIAFDLPVPAVDGNVLRVICRLQRNPSDITQKETKSAITNQLQSIYPPARRGDFTQSLMELGATVCLPNGAPLCLQCPLIHCCQGKDSWQTIPVKTPKAARKIIKKTVLLLQYQDQSAIQLRPASGLLASLWEFPNLDGHLTLAQLKDYLQEINLSPLAITPGPAHKHIFTHLEWQMISYRIQLSAPSPLYQWITRKELKNHSIPTAFKSFIREM